MTEVHNSESLTDEISTKLKIAFQAVDEKSFDIAQLQAANVLDKIVDEPNALFIIATIKRLKGKFVEAERQFKILVGKYPDFFLAHHELALTQNALKNYASAIQILENLVSKASGMQESWKLLIELLLIVGDEQASELRFNQYIKSTIDSVSLRDAFQALIDGNHSLAEQLCNAHLKQQPRDVVALRIMAEIDIKLDRLLSAKQLLEQCFEINPDYQLARLNYVYVLIKLNKLQVAMHNVEALEKQDVTDSSFLKIKATLLVKLGLLYKAIEIYEKLIELYPLSANLNIKLGHVYKRLGKFGAAIEHYERSIKLSKIQGEAYWSLANIKSYRFERPEVRQMLAVLTDSNTQLIEKAQLCFTLGKAFNDANLHDDSFRYYKQGNAIRQSFERYSAETTSRRVNQIISTFDDNFFSDRKNQGCVNPDPIFIVGVPRSGSSLLEKILASHSQVDRTNELPDMLALVRKLDALKQDDKVVGYPEIIQSLSSKQLNALGEEYLLSTVLHRKHAAFFIDTMPHNFFHIGLIKQILPNAKIIDARRHPIATCFNCYKQFFASGQNFSYDLEELGKYYLDYVNLMEHWDKVLPNAVLKVNYEELITNFDEQARRLLDYCELPFEQTCIEFYNNPQPEATASSEQDRMPIYKSGLRSWIPYERQLKPLLALLEPISKTYNNIEI